MIDCESKILQVSLWALPAENLRLDRPLLLSRVSRFAPINANCAPLTARTAKRLAPPGRAFAFNAPLSAVPLRSKKRTNERSFSNATTQQTTCFRTRPDRRNTGRFGRAKEGRTTTGRVPHAPR